MINNSTVNSPNDFVYAISKSGLSIYSKIEIGDPNLWIPAKELEEVLNQELVNKDLSGLPLRTRSKVVKQAICKALGYPVPELFKKTQPRFPGQNFDVYIQKSNNLQIWNEEISPTRRYVIIGVSPQDRIQRVKVVTGDSLEYLDTTGTLTQKYQARLTLLEQGEKAELVVSQDTDNLTVLVNRSKKLEKFTVNPTSYPTTIALLPIATIFERLSTLVGSSFINAGIDQERNRGAALHKLVCTALGYDRYHDDGRFPDIRNQLLEIKLQTSPTIDLGLVSPNSCDLLDLPQIENVQIRHCDVRYAIFYGKADGMKVRILQLFLVTGKDFFSRFPQFQGKVLNKKLQIPLPRGFFD